MNVVLGRVTYVVHLLSVVTTELFHEAASKKPKVSETVVRARFNLFGL